MAVVGDVKINMADAINLQEHASRSLFNSVVQNLES